MSCAAALRWDQRCTGGWERDVDGVVKAIIEEIESKLGLVEAENKQLQELNRKLTDDLMRYTYKDKLKEAQYIIEGQYNTLLVPQKYKYLLDESKTRI
jgi:putative sterol carrier protein